jgi:hypothetical protein
MKIGILMNVYASNYTSRCARLWHILTNMPLLDASYVVVNDFNHVELGDDQSQSYFGSTIGGRECFQ